MRRRGIAVVAAIALLVAGCARESGPDRFQVSGNVTLGDQPIAYGDILFTPDGAKGNSGPQGIAMIRGGKYDTAGADGQGVAGGPTIVRVTGFGAPDGKDLLCEYEYQVDLPKKDSTLKVEVPASAGRKRPASPEI